MARTGISYEQVAVAADALAAAGQVPTIKAVRERIGTGSPNTVHRHLSDWRAAHPQVAAVPELPAALVAAMATEIERAAAQARADAEALLARAVDEARELAAAGAALEGERDELIEQLAAAGRERDREAGAARERTAELERQGEELARAREATAQARIELAHGDGRLAAQFDKAAELAREVERLRVDLEAERAARLAAAASAAALAASLAAEQARLDAAAGELQQARLDTAAARLEARRAGEDAAELRGKLAALAPAQPGPG